MQTVQSESFSVIYPHNSISEKCYRTSFSSMYYNLTLRKS